VIALASAAWFTACGSTPRRASVPETPPQTARSEPPVVSGPLEAPPSTPLPTAAPAPVAAPPATAPSNESRDKQLEILTQAVIALHREVARNDAQAENLLKENERLRAEVDSLLRDLDKSRDANERVKNKLRSLQEQLRAIAEAPLLADQRDDETVEPSPSARGGATKEGGSPPPERPARDEGLDYVVVPGDTLFRIATAYGVDYRDLASENGIEDPAHIEVGQHIFIPGAKQVP
jgi:hypothetical protein